MSSKKKVLVLGASEKSWRYSHIALQRLAEKGHEVIALGRTAGKIGDVSIGTDFPVEEEIDTVSMYLNPVHQSQYEEAILELVPKRVIFNPGAENPEFEQKLKDKGVEVLDACTLVMLSTGQF